MQTADETLSRTSRSLAAQRSMASSYVAESMGLRDKIQASLQEATSRVQEEQKKVEALRTQLNGQQLSLLVSILFLFLFIDAINSVIILT